MSNNGAFECFFFLLLSPFHVNSHLQRQFKNFRRDLVSNETFLTARDSYLVPTHWSIFNDFRAWITSNSAIHSNMSATDVCVKSATIYNAEYESKINKCDE